MLCLRSPTVMVRMLDTSRGLYGPCTWHWGIASPRFSSVSWGCFTRTHTFGVCVWSSMRGQWPIIFAASVTWSRLPHRFGRSREAWERLHEKLWHFYDMKRRNKWSIHSTTTSWAAPEKEPKSWWDHDHIGCFADQVKLTRALVRDLDEAVKEVKLLGENEEESS
jgi:hypothetical protein